MLDNCVMVLVEVRRVIPVKATRVGKLIEN